MKISQDIDGFSEKEKNENEKQFITSEKGCDNPNFGFLGIRGKILQLFLGQAGKVSFGPIIVTSQSGGRKDW